MFHQVRISPLATGIRWHKHVQKQPVQARTRVKECREGIEIVVELVLIVMREVDRFKARSLVFQIVGQELQEIIEVIAAMQRKFRDVRKVYQPHEMFSSIT